MEDVWEIFENYLHFCSHAFEVKIHAFVLMNNHFHMLLTTPNENLPHCMNYLLRETSRVIGERTGRINHIYGGPYWWSLVTKEIYYSHCYKYIYRNPVEAGLSQSAEAYPFSTLPGLFGQSKLTIPVVECMFSSLVPKDPEHLIQWINFSYTNSAREKISAALKHREFHFARDPSSGKPIDLETEIS
jgi:REP element-mobilizing transposase RayT